MFALRLEMYSFKSWLKGHCHLEVKVKVTWCLVTSRPNYKKTFLSFFVIYEVHRLHREWKGFLVRF